MPAAGVSGSDAAGAPSGTGAVAPPVGGPTTGTGIGSAAGAMGSGTGAAAPATGAGASGTGATNAAAPMGSGTAAAPATGTSGAVGSGSAAGAPTGVAGANSDTDEGAATAPTAPTVPTQPQPQVKGSAYQYAKETAPTTTTAAEGNNARLVHLHSCISTYTCKFMSARVCVL
jgi:hypothetical protein